MMPPYHTANMEPADNEAPSQKHQAATDTHETILAEKQQRLLVESLYASWDGGSQQHSFLAASRVGMFFAPQEPPIVPNVLLSLGVRVFGGWYEPHNRSYVIGKIGKPPEVIIEIVTEEDSQQIDHKLRQYAHIGVACCVLYDPRHRLHNEPLRIYERREGFYTEMAEPWLAKVELGLTLWYGVYEGTETDWLRWYDRSGTILPGGAERAEQERLRAEQERLRAEQERLRAEQERLRAEQERQQAEQLRQDRETIQALLEQANRRTHYLENLLIRASEPSDSVIKEEQMAGKHG